MNNFSEADRIEQFEKLMNPYVSKEFRNWLISNGFFTAPASIHHHGAYTGALFDHSFAVTKTLLSFTERLGLSWMKERSPYIVGMFHDLCKIDNYTKKSKPALSPLLEGDSWEYNNAALLPGHGEKSVIMLQQHMNLTDEEMLCIRWHMGAFDDKEHWNSYGRSVTHFPNVAARILGV